MRAGASGGVNKAHIIDGRIPHALLLEIYTEAASAPNRALINDAFSGR